MELPKEISGYLRLFAPELGERILQSYPPLHAVERNSLARDRTLIAKTVRGTGAGNYGRCEALE